MAVAVNKVTGSYSGPIAVFRKGLPGRMRRLHRELGEEFRDNVEYFTPVETGELAASYRLSRTQVIRRPDGGTTYRGILRSIDDKASFVEEDTRPHRIPVATDGEGRFFKAKGPNDYVEHPGTDGAHMFALGADKTEIWLEFSGELMLKRFLKEAGL